MFNYISFLDFCKCYQEFATHVIAVLIFLWISQTSGYCQQAPADTAFITRSNKKRIELYTTSIQHQSRLFNGSDYVIYIPRDEEHPYFKMDDWTDGSVVYWNELYENVPLLYDIQNDLIVTEHNRGNPIKLVTEQVQSFTILGHTFVRLIRDDNNKISDGFYDQLYHGGLKIYAKHSKAYREKLETQQVVALFLMKTHAIILSRTVLLTSSNLKDLSCRF